MSTNTDTWSAAISLQPDQIQAVQILLNNQNYVGGDQQIQEFINQALVSETDPVKQGDLAILSERLGNAFSINANDGSWKSELCMRQHPT
jgi:hypothetical protein